MQEPQSLHLSLVQLRASPNIQLPALKRSAASALRIAPLYNEDDGEVPSSRAYPSYSYPCPSQCNSECTYGRFTQEIIFSYDYCSMCLDSENLQEPECRACMQMSSFYAPAACYDCLYGTFTGYVKWSTLKCKATEDTCECATTGTCSIYCASTESAPADPLPEECPIEEGTDVVIYGGDGPGWDCQLWEAHYFKWLGLNTRMVSAEQLQSADCGGTMASLGVKMFVMPGGNAYGITQSIKTSGTANVRAALSAGVLYVGTCAGWFYAATGYLWQKNPPGLPDAGYYNYPEALKLYPLVEGSIIDIQDHDVAPYWKMTNVSESPGGETLFKTLYWGGPTRGWKATKRDSTNPKQIYSLGDPVLYFNEIDSNPLASTFVNESYGKLLLFSPHLETEATVPSVYDEELTEDVQLINWIYRAEKIQMALGSSTTLEIPQEL